MGENIYLQYRRERENVESIEVEGAFIVYKFLPQYCYIVDVYCIAELRESGISYELADKVENVAKQRGYTKMLGSVDTTAINPETGLKACFKQGYKILRLEGSMIWLHKEI